MTRRVAIVGLVLAAMVAGGCYGQVERLITIDSEPQGARCWLNDNEIGRTPVTTPFTWYGTYSVRLEHPGYDPLAAMADVDAPVYQWIPLDLAFETVVPGTRYDEHAFHFEMDPVRKADPDALMDRAEGLRTDATEPSP